MLFKYNFNEIVDLIDIQEAWPLRPHKINCSSNLKTQFINYMPVYRYMWAASDSMNLPSSNIVQLVSFSDATILNYITERFSYSKIFSDLQLKFVCQLDEFMGITLLIPTSFFYVQISLFGKNKVSAYWLGLY